MTEAPKAVALAPVTEKKQFSKAEQLESMELALKQATEETHKKMLEAQKSEKTPEQMLSQSTTMMNLKVRHSQEEQELKDHIASEEKAHLKEITEMEQYQQSILKAEEDRKDEETAGKLHSEEMKLLQEEEAAKKAEAEEREQEFLQAQAVQETKAAAAKKSAAQANLARLKRKHELQRRNAEAKLKMLKIKQ